MKLFLLFAFVCSAFAAPEDGYPTVPVEEFDCSAEGVDQTVERFYSSPEIDAENTEKCNIFYRCVPGHALAYLYTCKGSEEVFDEALQICVNKWDTLLPCGTLKSTTEYTGTTSEVSTSSTVGNDHFLCDDLADGYYPNKEHCNSFFICNNDVLSGQYPVAKMCPPGLIWNDDAVYCDWPYNVPPPCGTKVTRDTQGPACEDDERYECGTATSPQVDTDDCAIFYNCDANINRPCPSKCPPGLCFDESLGYCNYTA